MKNHDGKYGVFSSVVYLSVIDDKIECPICGDLHYPKYNNVVICQKTNSKFMISFTESDKNTNETWAAFSLFNLFEYDPQYSWTLSKCDKFYFPRPWNINGEWISRKELELLYLKAINRKPLRILYLSLLKFFGRLK